MFINEANKKLTHFERLGDLFDMLPVNIIILQMAVLNIGFGKQKEILLLSAVKSVTHEIHKETCVQHGRDLRSKSRMWCSL